MTDQICEQRQFEDSLSAPVGGTNQEFILPLSQGALLRHFKSSL